MKMQISPASNHSHQIRNPLVGYKVVSVFVTESMLFIKPLWRSVFLPVLVLFLVNGLLIWILTPAWTGFMIYLSPLNC